MKSFVTPTYPINLNLTGEKVLVIGGGSVGMRKIQALRNTGADLLVCEPHPSLELTALVQAGEVMLTQDAFDTIDLQGVRLVFACTNDHQTNQRVAKRCASHHILCNVADDPHLCSFTVPSVVRRHPLQIAISTHGQAPSVSKRLRQELEMTYGDEYAVYAQLLGELRRLIIEHYPHPCQDRTNLIYATTAPALFDAVKAGWIIDPVQLIDCLLTAHQPFEITEAMIMASRVQSGDEVSGEDDALVNLSHTRSTKNTFQNLTKGSLEQPSSAEAVSPTESAVTREGA